MYIICAYITDQPHPTIQPVIFWLHHICIYYCSVTINYKASIILCISYVHILQISQTQLYSQLYSVYILCVYITNKPHQTIQPLCVYHVCIYYWSVTPNYTENYIFCVHHMCIYFTYNITVLRKHMYHYVQNNRDTMFTSISFRGERNKVMVLQ